MATIFLMNEEIARGMVCFFHQKKHSYLIIEKLPKANNRPLGEHLLNLVTLAFCANKRLVDFFTNSSGSIFITNVHTT
jgi:hypothetical protein